MKQLLQDLKALVAKEREINVEILRKLREVDESGLFARMGYSSLHSFCVRELRYSEAAADRRFQAMRMIRDEPVVEQKLVDGEMNLTTAAQLQRAFREADKQDVELPKADLIEAGSGKSSREADKEIRRCAAEAGVTQEDDEEEYLAAVGALLAHFSHAHPGLSEKNSFAWLSSKPRRSSIPPARAATPAPE